jgi:uncharacterized lipoprotein YddW (UPF0748 family)
MHDGPDGTPSRRHSLLLRLAAIMALVIASYGVWLGFGRPAADSPAAGETAGPADRGGAAARADPRGATCAGHPLVAQRELRGMWLTTVRNLDWPSRPGLPADQVRAEYRSWLDLAVRMNHNAVFVHVRPSGDAFWPSAYAPWSHWLTGRRDGQSPGWDPMEFIVAEAHARGLEFHAWFNPYKASQLPTLAELAPTHPLHQHPDWMVAYPSRGSTRRLYYDPGNPAARLFVEDSILDAVDRYDIDGVHFDDFFYPYPEAGEDFPDARSYAAFGAGLAKGAWRRHNVDVFVQEMNRRIKARKPWVKFGISPFGIWRNASSSASGSATGGLESYSAIFADTRRWVREGWLDYVVPQLYWHIGFKVADYAVLLPWWATVVKGTSVQLYIGQADYRVGESGPWRDPAQLNRQLALNDRYGAHGSIHFSARHVRDDALGAVGRYRRDHYAAPAFVPAMTHLPAQRPNRPGQVAVRVAAGSATVTWTPPAGGPAPVRYAVYRADGPGQPAKLVATLSATGSGERRWVDPAAEPTHAYCVTALDRLWNESR